MLRKISLAALFCFSPIAMGEPATAGHGCHHSSAATNYRAPVGHSHAGHWHQGHRAHHQAVPRAACCGAPSHHASSAYRGAQAHRGHYPHAPSNMARRPLVYDGYVLGAGPGYSSYRPNYDADPRGYRGDYREPGGYREFSGGNPFSGARLDLRID